MRSARLASFGFVLAALGGVASEASARVEGGSAYTKAQTFSAALRFLRVQHGYEVTERDPEAAYLLFRYPLPGQRQTAEGSLEVVETSAGVKIYVQLPRLPEYHEAVLRDGLLRKLRDEYGAPPPRAPAEKPRQEEPRAPGERAPEGAPKPKK